MKVQVSAANLQSVLEDASQPAGHTPFNPGFVLESMRAASRQVQGWPGGLLPCRPAVQECS
jgi:hypothetical protein